MPKGSDANTVVEDSYAKTILNNPNYKLILTLVPSPEAKQVLAKFTEWVWSAGFEAGAGAMTIILKDRMGAKP